MQIESTFFLALLLNIGLILAFSWFGISLLNRSDFRTGIKHDHDRCLASKLVRDSGLIIPRLKKAFRVRRMIKTNSEKDETPFLLPQFS